MSHKLGFKAKKGREFVWFCLVGFFFKKKDLFKENAKGTNFPVSEAELGVQQDSLGCGFSSVDCTKRRLKLQVRLKRFTGTATRQPQLLQILSLGHILMMRSL